MEQSCKKCESSNLVLGNFEYKGESASLGYQCSDCFHEGHIYYDITYTILNNNFTKNETKKNNKEKQT